jgi:hypothetical protein
MNRLYKLLEDKNYWYKKYLASNEAFLMALRHAPEIAIDEIELFYGNRESLLKILENLDTKVQELVETANTRNSDPSQEEKTKIQFHIREKDSIIEKIVALDTEIIKEIEAIQAQGAEKIKAIVKGKKALSKYKSGGSQSEKLDKRV